MVVTVMGSAQRHRELVADLASPRGACANFRWCASEGLRPRAR